MILDKINVIPTIWERIPHDLVTSSHITISCILFHTFLIFASILGNYNGLTKYLENYIEQTTDKRDKKHIHFSHCKNIFTLLSSPSAKKKHGQGSRKLTTDIHYFDSTQAYTRQTNGTFGMGLKNENEKLY